MKGKGRNRILTPEDESYIKANFYRLTKREWAYRYGVHLATLLRYVARWKNAGTMPSKATTEGCDETTEAIKTSDSPRNHTHGEITGISVDRTHYALERSRAVDPCKKCDLAHRCKTDEEKLTAINMICLTLRTHFAEKGTLVFKKIRNLT